MKVISFSGILMGLTLVGSFASPAGIHGLIKATVKSTKGDTHVELSGLEEWRYDVSRKTVGQAQHILIQLEGVTPDQVQNLENISDTQVSQVQVTAGLNGNALIDITAANPQISFFDYQTDSPMNLVFDMYKEDAAKKSPKDKKNISKIGKKKKPLSAEEALADIVDFKSKKKSAGKKRKGGRSVASVDAPEIGSQKMLADNSVEQKLKFEYGVFDGGDKDMSRFKIKPEEISEAAQIRSTNNLYLHFPALVFQHPYLQNLMENAPKYEVGANDSDENQQVRFIVKLFEEEKYAVVLRTLKFFYQKYPNTSYQKILDFVTADTYLGLWRRDHNRSDFEESMTRYKEILSHYPDDQSRYRTLMLVGLNYLEAGNNLGALSTFQVGIKSYPDSPYYWQMRMAVADTLNALSKDKAALQEYGGIESDPKSKDFGIEARYRRGDVFFKAKDYATASKEYKAALIKYPTQWIESPNVFFNDAEAQFWTKDYLASLDDFREFLRKFPNHPYGGYAMTRIGEILNILGAAKQKSTGAYLESYFRYRETPGAFVAKVHLDTERFGTMKEKEIAASLDELHREMAPITTLPDLEPFVTLSLADGYSSRKDFNTSNDMLVKYYQTNVLSPSLSYFKNRIVQNITSEMAQNNDEKKSVKALETYIKNGDSWLHKNGRIDTEFLAAKAYDSLGVPDEATKLYKDCVSRYNELSPDQLKRAQVFENLPSPDQMNLSLAQDSLKNGEMKKASEYLGAIKEPNKLSQTEQVQRSLILSSVAEKEERPDLALLALKDLTEHWNEKSVNAALLMKPWVSMARINIDLKKYQAALPWSEKAVQAAKADPASVDHEVAREALDLAGNLYTQLGKTQDAVSVYKLYVDKFADDASLAPVKYKLGKLYYDQKNFREANDVWASLKDDKDGALWSKIADEQLAQAKWDKKYDRYIERKPAGESK